MIRGALTVDKKLRLIMIHIFMGHLLIDYLTCNYKLYWWTSISQGHSEFIIQKVHMTQFHVREIKIFLLIIFIDKVN